MKPLPPLSNGATYCTLDDGSRYCTGSQMGRPNVLPDDRWLPCKLRLVRLRMVDYDYDEGGAYWGGPSTHGAMYRAIGDCGDVRAEVFVRATTRQEAKARVRERLPNARFY